VRPNLIDAGKVDGLRPTVATRSVDNPPGPQAGGSVHERAIRPIPYFITNAAGLIRVSMDYHVVTETAALPALQEMLRRSGRLVPHEARQNAVPPGQAAADLVQGRMPGATGLGWGTPWSTSPGWV
jgi:hypothetical protein